MGKGINSNVDKFLKYMQRPVDVPALELLYAGNNVMFERVDLYRDFILTLNDTITTTYLGDDVTNSVDQMEHFKWCWNRTAKQLKCGNLELSTNEEAYSYFFNFYMDTFYLVDKETDITINSIEAIWISIFDYNTEKTRSDLDTFLVLYKIFDKSYKKL